ncbi:hypothetical protein BJY01DRAFT_100971 [Aspergillus pseudoustus]|uniref:Secreted protein n=1 Tax=Aspergillus pseudoustus TaxID=1810923 RepID=A0ABR4IX51_9EURO
MRSGQGDRQTFDFLLFLSFFLIFRSRVLGGTSGSRNEYERRVRVIQMWISVILRLASFFSTFPLRITKSLDGRSLQE